MMDGDVKKIFAIASELSGEVRASYLERACAGDTKLRLRVEKLLSAAADEVFMRDATVVGDRPTAGLWALRGLGPGESAAGVGRRDVGSMEGPGTVIGPYRLVRLLGEGGFGSVFEAEQVEPMRRRVAIKILKLGMDTRAIVGRFEQERQALAIMDHANIAKVLDAGSLASGRPYFVMELVDGRPITEFCDVHRLPIRERLELLTQVCRAVQHAHTKGIIHRDIKPSNILVEMRDGLAQARVIDFGIAKAIERGDAEMTAFTEHRQLIGTPEYMSPEQAGASIDIDTRTDVYSLGVVMYELLTGLTPFDGRQLRSAAFAEMQRIIREVEPPRPSTRLQRSDGLAGIASVRGVEASRLGGLVRGELDWIAMKAIEKDRGRRYETPGLLAEDIERYMTGAAVRAAPPSTTYRVRTFARRHRVLIASITAFTLVLVGGLMATAYGLFRARAERDRAFLAEQLAGSRLAEAEKARDAADAARKEAERFNNVANAVTEFFTRDVLDLKPTPAGEPELTVREVLDRVPAKIGAHFSKEPAVEGIIRERVGQLYLNLGQPMKAAEFLEPAAKLIAEGMGPEHQTALSARHRLAELYFELERYERAAEEFGSVFEARRRVLGEQHGFTWNSLMRRGAARVNAGRTEEGLRDIDDSAAKLKSLRGERSRTALIAIREQIRGRRVAGRLDEAEQMARAALEVIRSQVDELGAAEASFRGELGQVLLARSAWGAALEELEAAVQRRERELAPEDGELLEMRVGRARARAALGAFAAALGELESCYAIHSVHHGATAPGSKRIASMARDAAARAGDAAAMAKWNSLQ